MLPRTLLFIWLGSKAGELQQLLSTGGEGNLGQLSFLLLLIVSIVGFYFYFQKIITKKVQ